METPSTAFVLGGGGQLGAHEVGMLQALFEREIVPDVIVGTSIGALNGAVVAHDPTPHSVESLTELWTSIDRSGVLSGSIVDNVRTLVRTGNSVYSNDGIRRLLESLVPVDRIEDLAVRFECVAASIERASARYFSSGPLVDAVLASSAVPGLLPPVEIDGEHYLDGGLVASIPLDRAIDMGATTIYVLQVGRIEAPLSPPTKPWEVPLVAFEISRRHRFTEALHSVPDGVDVHVLPTGDPKGFTDLRQYRNTSVSGGAIGQRIEQSRAATLEYLDRLAAP